MVPEVQREPPEVLVTDFAFRPITTWPGGLTRSRRRSPFGAAYSSTLELLHREVDHLVARRLDPVVIQLALSDDDIRRDGLPRAHARPEHPGVILSFTSQYGPLRYATDVFTDWQSNLRAIALGLESLRRVDRYGITKGGEQYAGWRALEAGGTDEGRLERGRRLISEHGGVAQALHATHPDHGGDPEDLQAVLAAREEDA